MIIYNGVDLSPYMKITDIRGRGLIQADFTEIVVPGRPGSYFVSKQKPKRILENDYKIIAHTQTELRQKIDELNTILEIDEPVPIVYADEPDKTYFGIAYSDGQEQQILSLQKGTLVFICFDPYKYGPLRTQTINVPPATFTRNSIAYLSDGTQVDANQPRFESGGILVEEGTTNLIPSALAKNLTSAWTSGTLNGTYTLSVRGGTGQVNISGGYTGSVSVGQTLTFNVSNATITLTPANGTPQFVQLEQKPYATSFVDGTRQPETLTLPTDGVLNPLSGTIEFWAYVDAQVRETSRISRFFSHFNGSGNANRITIQHNNSPYWIFTIADNAGNTHSLSPADSLTPDGWHYFAMVWDSSRFAVFIDGVKRGEILIPTYLPQTIGATIDIGHTSTTTQANTIISELRISKIARSDAEILDAYQNGFTVDEYTTAYLPLDGSLEVQTPTIVTNEGTAETYPVFTAYVKQPITFLDIISPDSYMRVGQPYSVDQMPVDGDQPVMQDEMGTLTGWGPGSVIDGGIIQGSFQTDGNKFTVKDFGPSYNGWAGPALKKSLPNPLQDFRVHALIDITSSANGVGRIEVYGLDTANNIVFRMSIGDFSNKTKDVKAFWELGPSTDTIFTTYGKKTGSLNDYYGSLVIERKGNRWHFYTAKRTGPTDRSGTYVDYVEKTFVDTKNQYTAQLAQIQVHIGSHLKYTPIPTMSINHVFVYDLHNPSTDQVPYIAYPGDVLQFDHKAACIYKNGDIFMSAKDFGASFFLLGKGETELAVNPNDAAIVTVDYRPRWY
ncbi:distal tail protein Dit [Caenibacillus caldisaponilyticus]|uniref:distal tail protein Dit n=1 Tax=Caenibacillus caldisaponilyticus TaxID=1674942 RepID=UPI000988711E|nr:distal tail protein Dit [Caenibacillus caldisaponilyticus]